VAEYRAFCDESGQRDYGPGTDRHFVIAAVLVPKDDLASLETELGGLKRAYFGDTTVEIKSRWIRLPDERQAHYIQPYGIKVVEIGRFVNALYRWIKKTPLKLLAGVVDKSMMQAKYVRPHLAGGVAYDFVLQRYQKFLGKRRGTGDVHFDDPAGKAPGGTDYRDLLQRQHAILKRNGCPYTRATFPSVEDLTFVDSAKSPFVQVADLVAYNTFRQFRQHGAAWENDQLKSLPLYAHFNEIAPAFDVGPSGEFSGFGVVKFPVDTHVRWVANKA